VALTTDNWIQLAVAIPIVSGFLYAVVRGLFKIATKINLILHQVTPNNGSSMNDRIVRLEKSQHLQTQMLTAIKIKLNI